MKKSYSYASNPFRFTGQWYDGETGQYYLRARMYDPAMMRFTGRDPVRGEFTEPLTLHKYLYCLNDPVNNADPSGEAIAARVLVAPVLAGHLTHALAISVTAYAAWVQSGIGLELGIAIDQCVSGVMARVTGGQEAMTALNHEIRNYPSKDFPYRSNKSVERIIAEHLQGMEGNPGFSGKDPENRWQRIFLWILRLIDSLKG